MTRPTLALLVLGCAAAGCHQTTPVAPTPASSVTSVVVSSRPASDVTYQMTATAWFSDNSAHDVTSEAQWESSNPGIASVSSTGLVAALATGSVDVRASYGGLVGTQHLVMNPSATPTFALTGFALEIPPLVRSVAGVTVRVTAGTDAGATTTTGTDGAFYFPALFAGTISLEFQRDGYDTYRMSNFTLAQSDRVDGWMVPTPPKNGAGATATARCNDGSWSWSESAMSACSANGGMAYAVCPGPLCATH